MQRWIFFLFLAAWPGYAVGVGTSAANFLKIGIGPRAIAMGEAHVGLANDVYAAYWNPAGLANLKVQEAGFVQNQYVEDISEQFLAYAFPQAALGTFAGSLSYLQMGRFPAYDAVGMPTGQVKSSDAAVALSYARRCDWDRRRGAGVAWGMSAKYIHETLDTATASAYAADVGVMFMPGRRWSESLEGWKVGAVVRNVGSSLQFDRDRFLLPRSLEVGLAYSGRWRDETFTFVLDGRQPQGGERSWGSGIELATLQVLFARVGFSTGDDWGNGLRWGGGLRFKVAQVDYAYAHAGGFGAVHRIGLTFRLGPRPEDPQRDAQRWYDQGMKNFKKQRYTEALMEFNKALEIDPSHPDALQGMKQSYEEIKTLKSE